MSTAGKINIMGDHPWFSRRAEDKRLWIILLAALSVSFIIGVIIPYIDVPEPSRDKLETIPPRLAKLLLEKKQEPKPIPKPKPKPEKKAEKKPEKKAEKKPEKKKEKPKEKPKPKPKPKKEPPKPKPVKVEQKIEKAREIAKQSGVVALADDLADLRESLDMDSLDITPITTTKEKATTTAPVATKLKKNVTSDSGGIATKVPKRTGSTQKLAKGTSTKVDAPTQIATAKPNSSKKSSANKGKQRTSEEIALVFDENKSAINAIYRRSLRKNPALQGKVVFKLTIDASGKVTKVDIVSSGLNDPKMERKLKSRIKLFKFKPSNSAGTYTHSIDFLPS